MELLCRGQIDMARRRVIEQILLVPKFQRCLFREAQGVALGLEARYTAIRAVDEPLVPILFGIAGLLLRSLFIDFGDPSGQIF